MHPSWYEIPDSDSEVDPDSEQGTEVKPSPRFTAAATPNDTDGSEHHTNGVEQTPRAPSQGSRYLLPLQSWLLNIRSRGNESITFPTTDQYASEYFFFFFFLTNK